MQALPDLETPRLSLRPRTPDDLGAIMRLNTDPDVMRYIAPMGAAAMTRESVAARSFTHVASGLGYWSVFAKAEDDAFIGYVGLIPDEDGGAQVSYRFAARHWGKGYAFEAADTLVGYGFATLALPRIAILTHPDNAASCRLALRLGFSQEARPAPILIGDPPVPGRHFGRTRADWQARLSPPAA